MKALIDTLREQLGRALRPVLAPKRRYEVDEALENTLLTPELARLILLLIGAGSLAMGLTAAVGLFEMTHAHALLLWGLATVELGSWWLIGLWRNWTRPLFAFNLLLYTAMLAPLVVSDPHMYTMLFASVFPVLGAFILINRRQGLVNLVLALLLPDLVHWLGGPQMGAEQRYNYILFTLLGGGIGLALATLIQQLIARLSEQVMRLAHLATHDPLTGALNRKGLEEHGAVMLSTHLRKANMPMTAAIIDLDFFKQVNDTWGHEAGDVALKHLVNLIHQRFRRRSDILARMGGDEFALLLPNTPLVHAHELLVALSRTLQDNLPEYEGERLPLALSIGAAALDRARHRELDDLLRDADQWVYQAKQAGRSHVCSPVDCTAIPTAFEPPASAR